MASTSNGKRKPKRSTASDSASAQPLDRRFLDLDQKFFVSHVTGQPVRVDEATDEEFDEFIRQYIQLGWTLEERIDALIDAISDGQEVEFVQPMKIEKLG